MSDDLIISGGGSTIVSSDAILSRLDGLADLATRCASDAAGLLAAAGRARELALRAAALGSFQAAATLHRLETDLESAMTVFSSAGRAAHDLGAKLRRVLTAYGAAEGASEEATRSAAGGLSWLAGRLTGLIGMPIVVGLAIDEALLSAVTHTTPAEQARLVQDYLLHNPGPITSPEAVAGVRAVADNADDFIAGILAIPGGAAGLLTGHTDAAFTAGALATALSPFGLLRETPVTTRLATRVVGGAAPATIRDRFDRIPHAADEPHGQQIRIDRYSTPGQPDRYDVYVGGTADFGLRPGAQPFDMTSNVAGVSGRSAASVRAVLQAMHAAGITAHTPVMLTGYSQGGMVATIVANSPHLDVRGLVTFGSPSGAISVPHHIPTLTVRDTDDLVPATDGHDVDLHPLVVERTAYDGGSVPSGVAVPAHQVPAYDRTASLIDQATSDEVVTVRRTIDGFGHDASSVETTTWVAERLAGDRAPAPAMGATPGSSGSRVAG